ncbi:AtpZ/AtpI family protein [Neptunomonas antarctica]|uniref:ATP synthase protein I n=1 Tax=Neptunomonas antarctica TaxID=619304 RepID=A0A1N7M522_9GAMM|nr:AtpZ/AtpI family protein [Neptunomonas antarctica]SIS81216.1 ATP synthase protein I [Neptunomonas antarctica]
MNDDSGKREKNSEEFARRVGVKAARKVKARRNARAGVWFGLGMFGLIGWSIVIPTLLGTGLGLWLDSHQVGKHSWTLALLMAGLTLGCFNAWHWISKEDQAMRDDSEVDDEHHNE